MKRITLLLAVVMLSLGSMAQKLSYQKPAYLSNKPVMKAQKAFAKQNATVSQLVRFEKAKALASAAKAEEEKTGFANKTFTDVTVYDHITGDISVNLVESSFEVEDKDVRATVFDVYGIGFYLDGKIVGKSKMYEEVDSVQFDLTYAWENADGKKFHLCGVDATGWNEDYSDFVYAANEDEFVGGWYDAEDGMLYIMGNYGFVADGETDPIIAEGYAEFLPKSIMNNRFRTATLLTDTDDNAEYDAEGSAFMIRTGESSVAFYVKNTDPMYVLYANKYPDAFAGLPDQWFVINGDTETEEFYILSDQNVATTDLFMGITDGEYDYGGAILDLGQSEDGALIFSLPSDRQMRDYAFFDEEEAGEGLSAGIYYLMEARDVQYYLYMDETGIKGVKNVENAAKGALYNLAGQKVGKNYKGVVVKDGKKFLQK